MKLISTADKFWFDFKTESIVAVPQEASICKCVFVVTVKEPSCKQRIRKIDSNTNTILVRETFKNVLADFVR